MVPMMTERTVVALAMMRLFLKEPMRTSSSARWRYQSSVKPSHWTLRREVLNEYAISSAIGT